MFKHIKLTTIRKILVISLVLSCAMLIIGAFVIQKNVSLIDDTWKLYQTDRSDKSRLEGALRAAIGYGGMIHEFKNFILRNDPIYMETIHKHIGSAESIIHQYSLLQLTNAELTALDDIQRVISIYEKAHVQVDNLVRQGYSITQLDNTVKVDDTPALRGLETLRQEVRNSLTSETPLSKARVSADLRAAIGYGGMIHEYKNYILRHEIKYKNEVKVQLQKAYEAIAQYRTLEPSNAEVLALNDIENTLQNYGDNLNIISQLISNKTSIHEIDKSLRIDDYNALRGLNIIDKEIYQQINDYDSALSKALELVKNTSYIVTWGVFLLLFSIFIFAVWLIQARVIEPVLRLTNSMVRLSNNDFSIALENHHYDNELGDIARTMSVFKENMIERHEAEIELEAANNELNVQLNNILHLREQSEQQTSKALALAEGLADARISAEKSTLRAEENELRVSSILNSVQDGIITINEKGIIESVNPATEHMFGYYSAELVGKNISVLVPDPHKSMHDGYLERFVNGGSTRDASKPIEQSAQHKDGSTFIMELRINTIVFANEKKIIGVIKDVTERKQWEHDLKQLAMTDPLTKLANRNQYNKKLAEAAAVSLRYKNPFALMLLDLDKFKPVNDRYGHPVGDSLLQHVANTLLKCCRETDTVARLGGDEFAIILPSSHQPLDTKTLADRIIKQVSQVVVIEEQSIQVGISIGICTFPDLADNIEALQNQADSALYDAKEGGRNAYRIFKDGIKIK
ncbi:MAG: diguanylate cyclase [Oleispira antarctica]|nr:diguanylate cyclase [Oleispira antarctica]MBQ0792818.1 diguanylate cyclase [Oleispira antarctica]